MTANKKAAPKRGRPRINLEQPARVRCLVSNVWLSTGKIVRGDEGVETNAPALKLMVGRGQVEVIE